MTFRWNIGGNALGTIGVFMGCGMTLLPFLISGDIKQLKYNYRKKGEKNE